MHYTWVLSVNFSLDLQCSLSSIALMKEKIQTCTVLCVCIYEVTDGLVVRTGVSVTWNVLPWSGGHEFEPRSGRTLGAWYFCPKSYLNKNCNRYRTFEFKVCACNITFVFTMYEYCLRVNGYIEAYDQRFFDIYTTDSRMFNWLFYSIVVLLYCMCSG